MSLDSTGDVIFLEGTCRVEEAEPLVAALLERRRPVDVSRCNDLHAAIVQALIVHQVEIVGNPTDDFLREFIVPALGRAHIKGEV